MAPAQVVEAKDLPPELTPAPVSYALAATAEVPVPGEPAAGVADLPVPTPGWLNDLEREARRRLEAHEPEVWDALTRQFEARMIHAALEITRGRRIEAAQRLGIGRNTITRKIQELGLDD